MPERIPDEKRQDILGALLLSGRVAKVAQKFDVSEGLVRIVLEEAAGGHYPEYAAYLPRVEAISRLNTELEAAKVSVPQAELGLTIFKKVVELGVEPAALPNLFTVLHREAGDTLPTEFVDAAQTVVKLKTETGMSYPEITDAITAKTIQLNDLDAKIKADGEILTDRERLLQESGVSHEVLVQYQRDRQVLNEAGVNIGEVAFAADFVKAALSEGFLENAKELARLQSKTRMNFDQLRQEHERLRRGVRAYRKEEKRLSAAVEELTSKVADLKKEENDQLKVNNLTKEQIQRYNSIFDHLNEVGITFIEDEKIANFLANLKGSNYDNHKVIQTLSRLTNAELETKQAEDRCKRIRNECESEQTHLSQLLHQTSTATTELEHVNSNLANAKGDLIATQQERTQATHRIEFADATLQLFADPSHVPAELLFELSAQLQMIVRARLNPASFYPIDFMPAWRTARSLLEHALGKHLVPREEFDEMLHRAVEKHDDLMLDKLGKLEKERADLMQVHAATVDKIMQKVLPAALNLESKGFIATHRCSTCNKTLAATVPGAFGQIPNCPYCHANISADFVNACINEMALSQPEFRYKFTQFPRSSATVSHRRFALRLQRIRGWFMHRFVVACSLPLLQSASNLLFRQFALPRHVRKYVL